MDIAALEAAWLNRVPALPGRHGWEPYDLAAFSALLEVAVAAAPGGAFVDAGCGIGTKCVLARQAGCKASGIDLVPEFVAEARRLGIPAHKADVCRWDYSRYGIVYVNHPLKDPGEEAVLERYIHAQMAPGAVLITVNAACWPDGWERLGGDEDAWTGVLVKPLWR